MSEDTIVDKVIGKSRASDLKVVSQSQTIESKAKKEGEKNLVYGIILLLKLILNDIKRVFVTMVNKSILWIQKVMVRRQFLVI